MNGLCFITREKRYREFEAVYEAIWISSSSSRKYQIVLSCYFRALRLGGVLTNSVQMCKFANLQMTPPSLPGTENPGKHGLSRLYSYRKAFSLLCYRPLNMADLSDEFSLLKF